MGDKNKRAPNWNDPEVKDLLKIWKEPDITERVAVPARDKQNLWLEMATLLHDKGHQTRSGEQIHNKIKALKKLHRELHDKMSRSGAGAVIHPFWDDLQDILGGRANVNPPAGSVGGSMVLDEDEDEEDMDEMEDSGVMSDGAEVENGGRPDDEEVDETQASDDNEEPPAAPEQERVLVDEQPHQQPRPAEKQKEGQPQQKPQPKPQQKPHQQQRQPQKRQRETKKEQTVNALGKKMKDIQSSSDKAFMAAEKHRREDFKESQQANAQFMQGMMQMMAQSFGKRRRAEDRRSEEMKMLLQTMSPHQATAPQPGSQPPPMWNFTHPPMPAHRVPSTPAGPMPSHSGPSTPAVRWPAQTPGGPMPSHRGPSTPSGTMPAHRVPSTPAELGPMPSHRGPSTPAVRRPAQTPGGPMPSHTGPSAPPGTMPAHRVPSTPSFQQQIYHHTSNPSTSFDQIPNTSQNSHDQGPSYHNL